jgi:hypothetical protein
MSVIMNTDGMIVDKELVDLANEVQKKFISLLDGKADWTTEQQIVAAHHLCGYVNGEIVRRILDNLMKKQGGIGALPTLKPVPPADKP